MEDGPPIFRQDTTCPALLIELTAHALLCTGLSPCIARLSRRFHYTHMLIQALGSSPFARRYWGNLG